ncbi:MAG: hypothetical protein CMK09_11105 [Ponticaulis sp.]|nr:hypothetical protein [Ponticaulis sp.]|tara:strand:- start:56972 stop:57709 length:738 start_codon:yes stop_codon:yes gene_type:complete
MLKQVSRHTRHLAVALAASVTFIGGAQAQSADMLAGFVGDVLIKSGIPQIDGFLPTIYEVPASQPLPIDGVYTISTIKKKIRIEGGRAYAVDGWNFALFMRIQPNMVTGMNFVQTGQNTYEFDDLPLMGRATMVVDPSGWIDVKTRGGTPYDYKLIPAGGYGNGFVPPIEPFRQGGPPPQPPMYGPPTQPISEQPVPPPASPTPPTSPPILPEPPVSQRTYYDAPDPNCGQEAFSPSTGKYTCMD